MPRKYRETDREYGKRYRAENKEKVAAAKKKWRDANKEKNRAYHKKWMSENKEYFKEYGEKKKRINSSISLEQLNVVGGFIRYVESKHYFVEVIDIFKMVDIFADVFEDDVEMDDPYDCFLQLVNWYNKYKKRDIN